MLRKPGQTCWPWASGFYVLSAERDRVKLRALQARPDLDARHDRCLGRSQQGSDAPHSSQQPASFNVGVMRLLLGQIEKLVHAICQDAQHTVDHISTRCELG